MHSPDEWPGIEDAIEFARWQAGMPQLGQTPFQPLSRTAGGVPYRLVGLGGWPGGGQLGAAPSHRPQRFGAPHIGVNPYAYPNATGLKLARGLGWTTASNQAAIDRLQLLRTLGVVG